MEERLKELKAVADATRDARIVAYGNATTKATSDAWDAYISACHATDAAWDIYLSAQTAQTGNTYE